MTQKITLAQLHRLAWVFSSNRDYTNEEDSAIERWLEEAIADGKAAETCSDPPNGGPDPVG